MLLPHLNDVTLVVKLAFKPSENVVSARLENCQQHECIHYVVRLHQLLIYKLHLGTAEAFSHEFFKIFPSLPVEVL